MIIFHSLSVTTGNSIQNDNLDTNFPKYPLSLSKNEKLYSIPKFFYPLSTDGKL